MRRGASIINCSWGKNRFIVWDTISDQGPTSPLIESAIYRALGSGRGGKGCIIVFSTGNFTSPVGNYNFVKYPANISPNIFTVGAMHVNGVLADDFNVLVSHYGPDMDIIAPGVSIPALDYNPSLQRDTVVLGQAGTSLSAPMAAGVAGLILSKNPTLTRKQVVDIIESTATKLPAYNSDYTSAAARPNGTWYEKSGYGLLNAHQALISTPRDICTVLNVDNQNLAGGTKSCTIVNSRNSKIFSGNNIFEHIETTNLYQGFEVGLGAEFSVKLK
jgi:subtilisin family serine protease